MKLVPRQGTIVEWGERKITLFPFATSAAFSIINSIAHVIDELAKAGVDVIGMLKDIGKEEKNSEEDDGLLKSIFKVLPVIAQNIKDDFDQLIINSTDDVTLEEIRAGETMGLAYDFDDLLYLHLIKNVFVINKGKWAQWGQAAIEMMDGFEPEKPQLSLGEKAEEVKKETATSQPEEKQVTAGESKVGVSS